MLTPNRSTARWLRWALICIVSTALARTELDIIPAPAKVVMGEAAGAQVDGTVPPGALAIRADAEVSIPRDARAARIAAYFIQLMHDTRALQLREVERSDQPGAVAAADGAITLRLEPSSGANPESYSIDVTRRGIVLTASDPRGLFYATVTLWQLCTAYPAGIPLLHLSDEPRLRWRGLMLDSARHFQSPQFIFQFIDWMALHKLNVLHWHLTDDQAWRLEIRKYPRLTQVGAWRVPAGAAAAADIDPATGRPRLYGGFYSQDDVRKIVAHAAERNVTVIPEIDMPGHATAAIVAYPQLGVTDHPPTAVPSDWGVYSNLYNVEDSTFEFLEDVLDEVVQLFPGEYVHVGGDEAVKDQWLASSRVQARMRELNIVNEEALQSYFMQRIGKHLAAHGRRLIGWDEILEGSIAADAVVMSWRGSNGAAAAVAAGHDAILSPWPTLYFDNRQGSGPGEPPGRGRVVSLREVYEFDPAPLAIDADARRHLLGLQANVWTEHIRTADRVAYMSFPRAAAVAEVGWSAAQTHDWRDFLRRLPTQLARYRALGLPYSADALQAPPRELGPFERHASQDLRTCTDKLVLSLEDDAPLQGKRAVFLIDIMNPCWILPSADLSRAPRLAVAVGQVPFNFQLGKERDSIRLTPPRTAHGELEVHLDGCDAKSLAVLPLAPAVANQAVTRLPEVRLPPVPGRHDLCLRFTQRELDPLWALDWVQLLE